MDTDPPRSKAQDPMSARNSLGMTTSMAAIHRSAHLGSSSLSGDLADLRYPYFNATKSFEALPGPAALSAGLTKTIQDLTGPGSPYFNAGKAFEALTGPASSSFGLSKALKDITGPGSPYFNAGKAFSQLVPLQLGLAATAATTGSTFAGLWVTAPAVSSVDNPDESFVVVDDEATANQFLRWLDECRPSLASAVKAGALITDALAILHVGWMLFQLDAGIQVSSQVSAAEVYAELVIVLLGVLLHCFSRRLGD